MRKQVAGMQMQKSFKQTHDRGQLYVVPTPIGNLKDITLRALETLQAVDAVLAEDTRHTKHLFQHFDIRKPLISFHEHNTMMRIPEMIEKLKAGNDLALVSDAGMPAISDPGFELVRALIAEDFDIVVLPGANAAVCALVGSGLPTDKFYFYGFLPKKKQEKEQVLSDIKTQSTTLIFYESPYRVKETLIAIEKVLGDRQVSLAREITKLHETYLRGSVSEVLQEVNENGIKGECCIVLQGNIEDVESLEQEQPFWQVMTIQEHLAYYEGKEMDHKTAMKQVAKDRGISKRDVYHAIHIK